MRRPTFGIVWLFFVTLNVAIISALWKLHYFCGLVALGVLIPFLFTSFLHLKQLVPFRLNIILTPIISIPCSALGNLIHIRPDGVSESILGVVSGIVVGVPIAFYAIGFYIFSSPVLNQTCRTLEIGDE